MTIYKYFDKLNSISSEFINWVLENIQEKDYKSYLSKEDMLCTNFVWDYFNDTTKFTKENFINCVEQNTDINDLDLKSLCFKRLYEIICGLMPEYIFCSNTPFAYKSENLYSRQSDIVYKGIEYDIKTTTASDYIYRKYIEPAILANRYLTSEEEYLISDWYYNNQLRNNTYRNSFDTNRIYIVFADEDVANRYKSKKDFNRLTRAIIKYLKRNANVENEYREYIHQLTGEKVMLSCLVIVVTEFD